MAAFEVQDAIATSDPGPVQVDRRFVWTSARCLEVGDTYLAGGKLRTILGVLEQGLNIEPYSLLEVRVEDGNVRTAHVFGWYDVLVREVG